MAKRKNYLNNKELLAEIHKSKCTFCSFVRPEYANYDGIATSRDEIDSNFIQEVKENRADKDTKERKQELRDQGYKSPKVDYTPEDYNTEGLIIRVMEHEHIPYDPERAKKAKKPLDEKVKCIFPPFKHYYVYNDLTLEEVGRSHWKGSISNGYFSQDHGYTTDRLASMYMQLVERYSQRGNWRGYCVDETTEALTKRGWLSMDEITMNDEIMSVNEDVLEWSSLYDIYRDNYTGQMHKITHKDADMFITPNHKLLTERGLVKFEDINPEDEIILFPGNTVSAQELFKNYSKENYEGRIWCPKTEYGTFVARRNGTVYITGNTYLDEMKSQALFQLAQIGLQFDESRSAVPNPFAYYTAAITNSFTRILNIEKKNQNIRDDILEMNDMNPSYTRQNENDKKDGGGSSS